MYVSENLEGTHKIIQQVADKVKLGEISMYIYTEDYIKYLSKDKYSTSWSISGPYVIHWKTVALSKNLAKFYATLT